LFTQEQRDTQELVVCYDANTGEEVWINQTQARFEDGTGDGPRATPTYHDRKLYTQGALGLLQCLDAATGEVLWDTNLRDDTGASVPQWGFASSPLIVGDLLIVFAGGPDDKGAAAYNIEDGELAWSAGEGTHGYTSAHLANFGGTEQVIITSDVGVQSFVPGDGELLWGHEWPIRMNPRCVQPIIPDDDALLIGTAGGQGTRRINIAKTGEGWTVDEDWTTKRFKPYFNDAIYFDGHAYGYDGNRLMCVDTATGDIKWSGERYGGQVLFLPDMKMLLAISEKGEVLLIEATPESFKVVTRFQAIEGKTWNHPVVAHGRLYVRNASEAAAFELPQP
jgi:outer membrane protein assembly factor BamB